MKKSSLRLWFTWCEMTLSLFIFAISDLHFGVVFPQKYPFDCHTCHMGMAHIATRSTSLDITTLFHA